MSQTQELQPPPTWLLLLEGRAILELGAYFAAKPLLKKLPRGDGHPVIVLPGFGTTDVTTKPLQNSLRDLGYRVHGWGMGRNMGMDERLRLRVAARVRHLHSRHGGEKVSLIGWSLGGIYAREIAREMPELVRRVVTLGSPFMDPDANNVKRLFWIFNQNIIHERFRNAVLERRQPPPVPTTAIHSKGDGIVSWQCSLEQLGPSTENIRVPGSHCGLGHNPVAIAVIAHRLAQDARKATDALNLTNKGWLSHAACSLDDQPETQLERQLSGAG